MNIMHETRGFFWDELKLQCDSKRREPLLPLVHQCFNAAQFSDDP